MGIRAVQGVLRVCYTASVLLTMAAVNSKRAERNVYTYALMRRILRVLGT